MHDVSGSQAFLKEDIENILRSLLLTSMAAYSDEFRNGYTLAILSAAQAFGIRDIEVEYVKFKIKER